MPNVVVSSQAGASWCSVALMPLFEYRCTACEAEFELLILPSSPEPVCPSCGAATVERLISMFAVSSEETTLRSRKKLGAAQRARAAAEGREREHYRTDHHDD